jgi:hypothetical protein
VKVLVPVQTIVAALNCALKLGAPEVAPVEVKVVVPSFLICTNPVPIP